MYENLIESAPCHTERLVGGVTVVELSGEIDIRTAPSLGARLDALTAGPRPELVVDLRSVSFIDCSGLRLLCRARNRTVARRGRLRLVTDSRSFLRILKHTRLVGVFEVHHRLPEALAEDPVEKILPVSTG
ncbi:STAS domain-containing protein [Streptomyces sp. CA-250714]|uniref:STAS domain-containing protein n=1 Tax=Streptomyces sp. CA-250714 TaxID=3240060 RepID=UPI003D9249C3